MLKVRIVVFKDGSLLITYHNHTMDTFRNWTEFLEFYPINGNLKLFIKAS